MISDSIKTSAFALDPTKMVYVIPHDKLLDYKEKPKEKEENIYNSLKFFMILSQILGIFPQENITTTPNELHFRWRSWKVLHSLIVIMISSFAAGVCFVGWFYAGYVFTDLVTQIFYAGALATTILYLRLAQSWSKLILLWCRMDKIMNSVYGYPKSLDKRLRLISAGFFILGMGDYGLSVLNRYKNMKLKFGSDYDSEKYFRETFSQLFRLVPFNIFTATLCSFIQIHATLLWAFNDLFIILMSVALALRFKQITDRLVENRKKFQMRSLSFWTEIREDYDRLSILCKELDSHISYIILLSFSLNIFFLLVQLYHSLETVTGFVGKAYFVYSFVYLILKVVSVSLYAAWINDESTNPASILNSVPASTYNTEIRRLLLQISFDGVALTGCRMFKVTRGIILSIAGAIVTYELVLIQFNTATTGK